MKKRSIDRVRFHVKGIIDRGRSRPIGSTEDRRKEEGNARPTKALSTTSHEPSFGNLLTSSHVMVTYFCWSWWF